MKQIRTIHIKKTCRMLALVMLFLGLIACSGDHYAYTTAPYVNYDLPYYHHRYFHHAHFPRDRVLLKYKRPLHPIFHAPHVHR